MEVEIRIEDDKTCSVLIGNEDIDGGRLIGLTPEQATAVKRKLEIVFKLGQHCAFRVIRRAVDNAAQENGRELPLGM